MTTNMAGGAEALGIGLGSVIGDSIEKERDRNLQRSINEQNRKDANFWNWKNREWAVEDWNAQNAYNDPMAQMQRLKRAGINPHLVYSKGATNTADTIKQSPPTTPRGEAYKSNYMPSQSLQAVLQASVVAQQVQNMKLQNQGLAIDNQRKAVDLQTAKQGQPHTLEGIKLANERQRVEISNIDVNQWLNKERLQLDKDIFGQQKAEWDVKRKLIASQTNKSNVDVKQAWQDYLNTELKYAKTKMEIDLLKTAINNAKWDSKLKQAEYNLSKLGLNKSDDTYTRMFALSLGTDPKSFEKVMAIQLGVSAASLLTKPLSRFMPPTKNTPLQPLKKDDNSIKGWQTDYNTGETRPIKVNFQKTRK